MNPTQDMDPYLKKSVSIDEFDIQSEFVRLPGDLAYWNERYANAFQMWNQQKLAVEVLKNRLWVEKRELLSVAPRGKVTVGDIEAEVIQDPSYQDSKAREAMLEAEKVRLYGVMDAIRSKREMLISLGAHQRLEMAADPMIRKRFGVESEVATQGGYNPR